MQTGRKSNNQLQWISSRLDCGRQWRFEPRNRMPALMQKEVSLISIDAETQWEVRTVSNVQPSLRRANEACPFFTRNQKSWKRLWSQTSNEAKLKILSAKLNCNGIQCHLLLELEPAFQIIRALSPSSYTKSHLTRTNTSGSGKSQNL